ncbi:hypothetical protein [Lacipirellula limnantheis]|uniref:Uncharacterized protein n=1 Tax=Lacipirellula limnantheis TaxID=2528024 RepID=A0A517TY17_9BACT|nr:hypothetical protein [Lacipirellula limnantheis]QDT73267.1 hypothetical protein I41_24560 [Lacipirellula limnantheis]
MIKVAVDEADTPAKLQRLLAAQRDLTSASKKAVSRQTECCTQSAFLAFQSLPKCVMSNRHFARPVNRNVTPT